MDVKVTWDQEMDFVGLGGSGFPVKMSNSSGPDRGVGPVEVTAMALAACTAMDVISILQKKQEKVKAFHVAVHADRASSYPKVITSATLEYVITGNGIRESSVRRAIELSIQQYCPVHAMLSKAFPITLNYSILEGDADGSGHVVLNGRCDPAGMELPPGLS